tara:strand:- start:68 stop:1327 length:1260 start_codon:yes stop_codon:yes gene_type:complete
MKKKIATIIAGILFFVIGVIYGYENPERIVLIKMKIKKQFSPKISKEIGPLQKVSANSYNVEFSKIISLTEKTAFIINEEKKGNNFFTIYTQDGFVLQNFKQKKLKLPNFLPIKKKGGIKTIFTYEDNAFALISSKKNSCYYASIVFLKNAKEIFKTKCLPNEIIDYNGLGSANIHLESSILLSIGTPEAHNHEIAILAQNRDSMYGKIIEISKNELDKIINNQLDYLSPKIFSLGHRVPQGLTKIGKNLFSVEHGPRGGDELNKIIRDKNYGWPIVSYGIKYIMLDNSERFFKISHEKNGFEEPLFALVPSVGISALNKCPNILNNYYKKPCLMALSLYGNGLRPGRSIIIFLLNEKMDKVNSTEKIFLRDDLKLRHFVTNSKNELFEDKNGDIYISADKKGIYRISFVDFFNVKNSN